MNILKELTSLCESIEVPVETGVFSGKAPGTYVVLVPLNDSYPLNADNYPQLDYQEVRISIFTKTNYIKLKNKIITHLLGSDFYITDRRYNGFETGSGYHQYTIDVAKQYDIEEEI